MRRRGSGQWLGMQHTAGDDRQQGLVAEEGVGQGSAASAAEGGADPGDAGVVGAPPAGAPVVEEDPAPPVGEVGADGEGQQLEVGEG